MHFIGNGSVDVFLTVVIKKKKNMIEDDSKHGKTVELKEGGEVQPPDEYEVKQEFIKRLDEGSYFGEVALITNLKWTTTVRTNVYSTIAHM